MSVEPRNFVVAALRSALGYDGEFFDGPKDCLDPSAADAVARIAVSNKIGGLVRTGVLRAGLQMPRRLDEVLKADQSRAVAKNLSNLHETEKVLGILGKRFEVLVIKGPVRSFELFGQLDSRPSNDIDILVRRSDYEQAAQVLCENSYLRGVSRDDRWWHQYLGESPFLPKVGHCTVDLHNKVQQPGGPSPRDLSMFFRHARVVSVANRKFSVPGPHEALLLAYVSASKALRSGELWLAYAAEIAICRMKMSEPMRREFDGIAHRQGLARLVRHVNRVVDCMMALPGSESAVHAPDPSIKALAAIPFGDGRPAGRKFHRSRLIWEWVDGAGLKRISDFARHSAELIVSDMRRTPDHRI